MTNRPAPAARSAPSRDFPAPGARLPAAMCLAAVLLLPSSAWAQRDTFMQALLDFHTQLAGTYGDEGPQLLSSLDRMAASLTAWERDLREREQELPARAAAVTSADRVTLHTTLAAMYVERGRHADALREIDAALALDDRRAGLHLYRGLTLTALGRRDEAMAAHREAWALTPDDPVAAYLLLGSASERDQATAPDPALESLLAALAAGAGDSRRPAPRVVSVMVLPDASAAAPLFPPAAYATAFALLARGAYAEAIDALREIVARDSLVVSRGARSEAMREGAASLRTGDLATAIRHLQRAVEANPDASEPHRLLGAAYMAAGASEVGLAHLEAAVQRSPRDERSRVALGRALVSTARLQEAERVFRATIETLPESHEARWPLVDVYVALGRAPEAVAQLETLADATVLAGRHEIFWRLAVLHHRHQRFDRAAEALAARARLTPNSGLAHKDLGLAYVRAGRDRAALTELAMAALMAPDDPDTLTAIGQLHVNAGRYRRAEPVLRRALVLKPDLPQARYALGQALVRLGRTGDGRRELARFARLRAAALDSQRQSFELDRLRREAERHAREGRHERAAALWQEIINRKPDEPDVHVALGDALARVGRLHAAAGHMAVAAALGAGVGVYRRLADIYEDLGQTAASATARLLHARRLKERASGGAFERLEPAPQTNQSLRE